MIDDLVWTGLLAAGVVFGGFAVVLVWWSLEALWDAWEDR